jgi:predicted 3-demethylubiquinone-9 3-methyltransferase (glyoxalase superfamily)
MMTMKLQKISTNLWFDDQAEQAAEFYSSIFKNSKIGRITHYVKGGHEMHRQREGTVMTVEFEIEGQAFVALNGGSHFKFNEAISFIVNCETQEEVDYYWEKLSEGGDPDAQQCGWLKDKFGVSWQIVPTALTEMVNHPDQSKVRKVLTVMYPMKKLDIESLKDAFES